MYSLDIIGNQLWYDAKIDGIFKFYIRPKKPNALGGYSGVGTTGHKIKKYMTSHHHCLQAWEILCNTDSYIKNHTISHRPQIECNIHILDERLLGLLTYIPGRWSGGYKWSPPRRNMNTSVCVWTLTWWQTSTPDFMKYTIIENNGRLDCLH